MNQETRNIKEALQKFSEKYGPAAIIQATVTAVNIDSTINVTIDDNIIVEDVRLRSVVKDGGKVLMVPKVGSIVMIARIENEDEFIVVAVEEVTDVEFIIEGSSFRMDATGFLFKKDGEDLLSIITDLINGIENAIYNTSNGPTTGMMPASTLVLNGIKTRVNSLLKSN